MSATFKIYFDSNGVDSRRANCIQKILQQRWLLLELLKREVGDPTIANVDTLKHFCTSASFLNKLKCLLFQFFNVSQNLRCQEFICT